MSVNLLQHREDLLKAFNSVIDAKNSTDWAIFSYDGNSNTLKLLDTGDGGIEEMASSFNSGKIMYAVCQIKEPSTGLNKIMLINWQGEGVPSSRLGACASHISEVQKFFKGSHLTHFARNEDDVEPEVLMTALKKVSYGAKIIPTNESAHEPSYVGSVYQRVNPSRDINTTERDKFWSLAEKEESARIDAEKRRFSEEKQRVDEEKKRLQERLTEECQKDVNEVKRQSIVGNEVLRKERLQEVKEVIKPHSGLKAMWEQKTNIPVEQPKSPDRESSVKSPVVKKAWPPMPSRESFEMPDNQALPSYENGSKISSPTTQKYVHTAAEVVRSPVKRDSSDYEKVTRNGSHNGTSLNSTTDNGKGSSALIPPHVSPSPPPEQAPVAPFKSVLPPRVPDSDNEEEEEQDWDSPPLEDQPLPSAAPISPNRRSTGLETDYVKDPALGIQARALWDYEAADETEIKFDPGDIVTHIEFTDEGWWRGRGPDGKFGLFPSNYVELLE